MGKFFASDSSVDQVGKEKSHGDVKMLDFSEYMGSSDLWKWTLELLEQTCIYLVSFLVCLLKAWVWNSMLPDVCYSALPCSTEHELSKHAVVRE